MHPSFVSRLTKCESCAPPLTNGATPQVAEGRKNDLNRSDFDTLSARRVVIFGVLTQFCALFRTVHAKSRSEKTTPFHIHPHPLKGVIFGVGQTQRKIVWGHPVYTALFVFFESDHPRPNYPFERPTPFRKSAIFDP